MSGVLSVNELLNPEAMPVDVLPLVQQLARLSENTRLMAPREVQMHLNTALEYLQKIPPRNPSLPRPPQDHSNYTDARIEEYEVKLTRETTLDILYRYPLDAFIEYPETSTNGAIGHLFRVDPDNWRNPILDVAYSRGKPKGQTIAGNPVTTRLLVDSMTKEPVPCVFKHSTCSSSILSSLRRF